MLDLGCGTGMLGLVDCDPDVLALARDTRPTPTPLNSIDGRRQRPIGNIRCRRKPTRQASMKLKPSFLKILAVAAVAVWAGGLITLHHSLRREIAGPRLDVVYLVGCDPDVLALARDTRPTPTASPPSTRPSRRIYVGIKYFKN